MPFWEGEVYNHPVFTRCSLRHFPQVVHVCHGEKGVGSGPMAPRSIPRKLIRKELVNLLLALPSQLHIHACGEDAPHPSPTVPCPVPDFPPC